MLILAVGAGASVPVRGAAVADSSAPMMHDMAGMAMANASDRACLRKYFRNCLAVPSESGGSQA